MVCRVTVTCLVLFIVISAFGFTEGEIRRFETQTEVEADLYVGDEVVYYGRIDNLNYRLSDFQVASMNVHELMLLRNAVFAKYGYHFNNGVILEHFQEFDWYEPEHQDVSEMLSDTDIMNVELIRYYEDRLEASETESPTEPEMIGFWHGNDCVGSGYSDRYYLYADGRFIFLESTMNAAARLRELSGEWYLDENHLVLEADSAVYELGGEIVEPYASIGSEFCIENGEQVPTELHPHEVFRLPLEEYSNGGELEDFELLPSVRIGYRTYWRMSADPENSSLY
jgi:hypothetical protein